MDAFGNALLLGLALLLVLLNGFFVAAEFAIVKLRATRVVELRGQGGLRGRLLAQVHGHLDAYLSACQLGITLASLGLGWIGEPAFAQLIEGPLALLGLHDEKAVDAIAFGFAFSLLSFLHIVVGELAPKSMALRQPETTSLWTAAPLWLFYWLMWPFIRLLNASANRMLGWLGLDQPGHEGERYSAEELRLIVARNRHSTPSEHETHRWLAHALELPELVAEDLMRPWRELIALEADDEAPDLRRRLRQHHFSRYPVLDATGTPLGLIHVKDYLAADEQSPRLLNGLLRPLLTVPADLSAPELLRRFRRGDSHFAVVQDRDARLIGFLTLEDVIESLVGDIRDEHEQGRRRVETGALTKLRDGSYLARGDAPLYRIERALGPLRDSAAHSTLAGWLMARFDHVPITGESLVEGRWRFHVQAAKGPRLERIHIQQQP